MTVGDSLLSSVVRRLRERSDSGVRVCAFRHSMAGALHRNPRAIGEHHGDGIKRTLAAAAFSAGHGRDFNTSGTS